MIIYDDTLFSFRYHYGIDGGDGVVLTESHIEGKILAVLVDIASVLSREFFWLEILPLTSIFSKGAETSSDVMSLSAFSENGRPAPIVNRYVIPTELYQRLLGFFNLEDFEKVELLKELYNNPGFFDVLYKAIGMSPEEFMDGWLQFGNSLTVQEKNYLIKKIFNAIREQQQDILKNISQKS